MKKKDNLIHVRLDYDEAMESRRDLLNTETNLIQIAQATRRYRILRLKELGLKIELFKKIKDFKTNIGKLKILLPKIQIPKILKKHEEEMHFQEEAEVEKKKEKKKKTKQKTQPKKEKKPPADDLELQLKEIQDKLGKLG